MLCKLSLIGLSGSAQDCGGLPGRGGLRLSAALLFLLLRLLRGIIPGYWIGRHLALGV